VDLDKSTIPPHKQRSKKKTQKIEKGAEKKKKNSPEGNVEKDRRATLRDKKP